MTLPSMDKQLDLFYEREDLEPSVGQLFGVIENYRLARDEPRLADALRIYGKVLKALGQSGPATSAFQEARRIFIGNARPLSGGLPVCRFPEYAGQYVEVCVELGNYANLSIYAPLLDAYRTKPDRLRAAIHTVVSGLEAYGGARWFAPDRATRLLRPTGPGRASFETYHGTEEISPGVEAALQYWWDALPLLDDLGLSRSYFVTLSYVMNALESLECYHDAISCHYTAVAYAERVGWQKTRAEIFERLAVDLSLLPGRAALRNDGAPLRRWIFRQGRPVTYMGTLGLNSERMNIFEYLSRNGKLPANWRSLGKNALDKAMCSQFTRVVVGQPNPFELSWVFLQFLESQACVDAMATQYLFKALEMNRKLKNSAGVSSVKEKLRGALAQWEHGCAVEVEDLLPVIRRAVHS